MDSKTDNGVIVTAQQRAKADMPIPVGATLVCAGNMGELILASAIGDEHGMLVQATISLDEVLAWLPEMTQKARVFAAAEAHHKLTQDLRQEGYRVTTYPRVKITPLSVS